MSIKRKIPIFIGALVLVTMIVASTLVYCQTSSKLYNNSKIEMQSLTRSYTGTLEDTIDKEKVKVEGMSNKKSVYDLLNLRENSYNSQPYKKSVQAVSSELVQYVKEQGNLEHAFIVDKTGTIIADSDSHLINTNISDREYNSETLKDKDIISETMTSKSTGAQIIIFTNPVRLNGKTCGYFATAVIAKSFSNPFKNLTVTGTEGSYAYLVDENGNMIFHPESNKIGKPIENNTVKTFINNIKNANETKLSYIDYEYNGKDKMAYFNFIPNVRWTFVLSADRDAVISGARKVTFIIVAMMFLLALAAIIVGFILSKKITGPMGEITKIIDRTSKLDLSEIYESDKYRHLLNHKDEIGDMYRAIVSMRSVLRKSVNSLMLVSEKINNNAAFLNNLTVEVKEYLDETLEQTENISAGMQENSATSEEIAASSGEMGNAVNEMANRAEEGSKTSENIEKRAESLKQSSSNSQNQANNIYACIKSDLEEAIQGSKSVNKISQLTGAIIDITEQTNLLALNASIEAARAGEAGRGFAIVAEEVKELAKQSGETASNIKNIVAIVEKSVSQLVESSNSVLGFIENTVIKDYDKLNDVAVQYSKDSQTVNNFMIDFSAVSEELNASIEGIVKAINEMAKTVSDGAGKIQHISEKSNDISQKIEDIDSAALENRNSANVLKDIIKKFNL
ncbi:MAG: methyl-accepting chemotaxis protein [Clostridium sp.]|jgi:methyl-accepting chemotaxis protein|uniref:methyl-accepting chemotaxis protein n=1 Tax=Clostridium sp. TaxID=1506 RepID=UPI0025BC1467|nr:methyl-accepting chemotaxis protein [Clostridium sp.]MCH3963209.1 methyl-accepting chemotaxis protein [Clostridium sp.]MCI1716328.1 methyl-accepting chemotaxis protein [Clostridium sp.]MCI1800668.1 methyl-accepting chemotaxis protein [Clostridium sp.]MCI1814677.1 methyl-accepting chemotaxis protein [Clostridium sp.]MCI1871587.1 methyl-accepting chemotaxis protein [Clostridium sp.]